MYATVVVDISSKQLNRLFEYKIPPHLTHKVKKGMRVVVDFNNRKRLAYVVNVVKTSKHSTKEVLYVLDDKPILTNVQLKMIEYLQKKSFSTYVETFQAVVPEALHGKYEYSFEIINPKEIPSQFNSAIKDKTLDIKKIKEEDFNLLYNLISKGYIKKHVDIKNKLKITYTKRVFIKNKNKRLTLKQEAIVNALNEPTLINKLIAQGYSKNIIERLINNGVLGYELVETFKEHKQMFNLEEDVFELTVEQQKAVSDVNLNKSGRYLLYGPPSSGKTEVYLRLIEKVLKLEKQVLVLVPEISLIPQMVSRIKERYSHDVAVYHSGLTAKTRYDTYRKIRDQKVKIIVGTRSSIFLPIDKLGLIILDEAHDMSFIQKNPPYYDAKDLSFLLSEIKNCPVVLGTATPTVSLYYEADLGILKMLRLSKPIIKKEVKIKLIDMKEELIQGNLSMFSNDLKAAINETLQKGEQIIILVNRRGYAPFVLCRTCGFVYKCPTCDVSLVFHKKNNSLKCHHCGYSQQMSTTCVACKTNSVRPVGFGSEQVEEELQIEFPGVKVIRMDSDTTSRRGSHDKLLTKFLNKEADVLLGTQMVSKGHHFENVSLVVVMLADQMLKLSSYLANEKTYNLLTQHIGRIRKHDGKAILQAYDTTHYVLESIVKKDFKAYYEKELSTRKLLKLEPIYNVVKVTFKGKEISKTYRDLEKLKNNFISRNTQIEGFGPSEDYMFYLNGRYHYSVTFKIPKSFNIDSLMNYFDRKYAKEYLIDIDYYPEII